MPSPMILALLQAVQADQAAQECDPHLLTDGEKNAKIRALQERVRTMESIATFLCNLLQAVEQTTHEDVAGGTPTMRQRLVLDICNRRWECATPVTLIEPETGAESFMRRSL